jgi:predicted enzyme related to lactoylglutathione lyase
MTTASAVAINGIDLVGVVVPDIHRSLAFYRDQLGLVPIGEGDEGAEFHFPDGSTFGLWAPEPGAGFEYGLGIMLAVDDAAAAAARFRDLGASIADPFESPVCHMALGKDPEGNKIIIHQRKSIDPHRPPAARRTPTSVNGIDLCGYLVADAQGETAFYREVLGMTPTHVDEQGRGAEFTLRDGNSFGVWHMPDGTKGGFIMFAVDDAQAKVAELRARGVQIGDVTETPVCIMSYTTDPDGVGIIVHQRKG